MQVDRNIVSRQAWELEGRNDGVVWSVVYVESMKQPLECRYGMRKEVISSLPGAERLGTCSVSLTAMARAMMPRRRISLGVRVVEDTGDVVECDEWLGKVVGSHVDQKSLIDGV